MTSHIPATQKKQTAPASSRHAIQYSESVARSLFAYASTHPQFAAAFERYAMGITLPDRFPPLIEMDGSEALLLPRTAAGAWRRARWLVDRLGEGVLPGSAAATARLYAWLHTPPQERPKPAVVGIVGLAIPGPTLGRIRKRVRMAVIVRRDVAAHEPRAFFHAAVDASHGVMRDAIEMVGGFMKHVEPDVAEWFFQDRALCFYAADRTHMHRIIADLRAFGIPFCSVEHDNDPGVIALHPSIHEDAPMRYWRIEPLSMLPWERKMTRTVRAL